MRRPAGRARSSGCCSAKPTSRATSQKPRAILPRMPPSASKPPRPEILSGLGAAILDALPVGIYVVDRQLRVVAWNAQREQGPIGKPRRRVLGKPLRSVLNEAGYRALEPVMRGVLQSGEPHEQT